MAPCRNRICQAPTSQLSEAGTFPETQRERRDGKLIQQSQAEAKSPWAWWGWWGLVSQWASFPNNIQTPESHWDGWEAGPSEGSHRQPGTGAAQEDCSPGHPSSFSYAEILPWPQPVSPKLSGKREDSCKLLQTRSSLLCPPCFLTICFLQCIVLQSWFKRKNKQLPPPTQDSYTIINWLGCVLAHLNIRF